jgi:hypothetical protein
MYATAGGHIFVTTDRGATWHERNVLGATDHFAFLLVSPTASMTAYAVRDRFGGGHIFRTANGGQSWTDLSGNLPDLPAYTLVIDTRFFPNVLYLGTDNGVFFSTGLSASWAPYKTGLPNAQVVDLKLNTNLNILAAGTHGRGLWEILVDPPAATIPPEKGQTDAAGEEQFQAFLLPHNRSSLTALGDDTSDSLTRVIGRSERERFLDALFGATQKDSNGSGPLPARYVAESIPIPRHSVTELDALFCGGLWTTVT